MIFLILSTKALSYLNVFTNGIFYKIAGAKLYEIAKSLFEGHKIWFQTKLYLENRQFVDSNDSFIWPSYGCRFM